MKTKQEKISIVGTAGVPANYEGFETLAEYLVRNLGDKLKFTVYCSSLNYNLRRSVYKNARLVYIPLNANGVSSIFYDCISLIHSIYSSSTILVLGVSGAILFPFIRIFTKKKVIVNIDGLEWKRSKWSRLPKMYLKWQEKLAVKYSHEVIADNISIQKYITKKYDKKSVLIEYGGDHSNTEKLDENIKSEFNLMESYAFTVCRIEPENNIHIILEAFSKLEYPIVIVGNWNSNNYGQSLRKQYTNCNSTQILDPIYDQHKLNQIRSNCSLYIHGHSAGGTNPSLVEAMSLRLPIFCWNVNYNRHTTENKSKYFNSSKRLIELVESTSKKELSHIAENMHRIANRKYTWKKIAVEYERILSPSQIE